METGKLPSAVIGQRIAYFRQEVLGLSVRELAARLDGLGRRLLASGVSKVETGQRKVDVDDLVAFALVLGVPVHTLLVDPASGTTALTSTQSFPTYDVALWLQGRQLPNGQREDFPAGWSKAMRPFSKIRTVDKYNWRCSEFSKWWRRGRTEGLLNSEADEAYRKELTTLGRVRASLAGEGVSLPAVPAPVLEDAATLGVELEA